MSYNKLGFTSGQTLKAEHLNHMEEGIANVSWNDLTDKPFGESGGKIQRIAFTFKSSGTGLGTTTASLGVDNSFVLVEGEYYEFEILEPMALGRLFYSGNGVAYKTSFMTNEYIRIGDSSNYIQQNVNSGAWDIRITETGDQAPSGNMISVNVYTNDLIVYPLDEKFLPESVDSVTIRSSTADSTKKFKITVDDSGTISATEVTE